MQYIPVENFSIPQQLTETLYLTKDGKEYAAVVPAEMYKEFTRYQAGKEMQRLAREIREEAKAKGMTEEILKEILADLS